jgi:uncharacterized protein YndB with AHSA1/START domain
VQLSRFLQAAPERVFAAWVDPVALVKWLCPFGNTLQVQSLDARSGGRYAMRMLAADGADNLITGEYRVFEPSSCLEFTWNVQFMRPGADRSEQPRDTLVRVDLVAEGTGTRLTLTHDRFDTDKAADDHRRGWDDCLEKLSTTNNSSSSTDTGD